MKKFYLTIFLLLGTLSLVQAQAILVGDRFYDGFAIYTVREIRPGNIIYMTDVQEVKNVWYDSKTKFLLGREHYSSQLKNYLENSMQQPNRVCVVMFAETRKEAEKLFIKMRKEYTVKAKGRYDVRYLTTGEFKFETIDMSDE